MRYCCFQKIVAPFRCFLLIFPSERFLSRLNLSSKHSVPFGTSMEKSKIRRAKTLVSKIRATLPVNSVDFPLNLLQTLFAHLSQMPSRASWGCLGGPWAALGSPFGCLLVWLAGWICGFGASLCRAGPLCVGFAYSVCRSVSSFRERE